MPTKRCLHTEGMYMTVVPVQYSPMNIWLCIMGGGGFTTRIKQVCDINLVSTYNKYEIYKHITNHGPNSLANEQDDLQPGRRINLSNLL